MPFSGKNVAAARSYIYGLPFKKPISQLSDKYVVRVANQVERQTLAGLAPSIQAARGHAMKEKGKAPKHLPAPAAAYKKAPKVPNPARPPSTRSKVRQQAVKVGHIKFSRLHGADLPEFMKKASHVGGRKRRLKISFQDKNGIWHTMGQKGGMKVSTLRGYAKGSDSLADLVNDLWQMFYGTDEEVLPDDPADLQIELFSVSLGNA